MNNTISIDVEILEDFGKKSVPIEGKNVDYRNLIVRFADRIIKIKSSLDLEATEFIGKKCSLVCSITPGQNLGATLRAVSIQ